MSNKYLNLLQWVCYFFFILKYIVQPHTLPKNSFEIILFSFIPFSLYESYYKWMLLLFLVLMYFYLKSQCSFYWSTYISPNDIFLMINGFTFVLVVTFWEIYFVESCNVSLFVSFIFHDLWKTYVCRILSIKHIYSLGMSL